jgi:hypothetical protein
MDKAAPAATGMALVDRMVALVDRAALTVDPATAPVVLTEPTVDRAATGRARPNALAGSGDSLGVVARALFHRVTRRTHHNSAFSVVGAQFPAHALSVTGNIEMRNLVQP